MEIHRDGKFSIPAEVRTAGSTYHLRVQLRLNSRLSGQCAKCSEIGVGQILVESFAPEGKAPRYHTAQNILRTLRERYYHQQILCQLCLEVMPST